MPIHPFPEKSEFRSKEFFGGPNLSVSFGYLVAHVDGGARGNPGPAGFGVVIEDEMGRPVAKWNEYLGKQTNNYAEYSALLAVLKYATKHSFKALKVFSDSELMVKQIMGEYKVNHPALKELHSRAARLIDELDFFEIHYVPREKNRDADWLANLAMDRGTGRGSSAASDFRAAVKAVSGGDAPATKASAPPAKPLRGLVKGGVIHLLEGELPEGIFVRVTPE